MEKSWNFFRTKRVGTLGLGSAERCAGLTLTRSASILPATSPCGAAAVIKCEPVQI